MLRLASYYSARSMAALLSHHIILFVCTFVHLCYAILAAISDRCDVTRVSLYLLYRRYFTL